MLKVKSSFLLLAACLPMAAADQPAGLKVFTAQCSVCHDHAQPGSRTPAPDTLRKLPVTAILQTLETGVMRTQGALLTATEKRDVANYLGVAVQNSVVNACQSGTAWTAPESSVAWTGWSPGTANWRFQPAAAAGVSAANLPKLKLQWAYGFSGGTNMRAQPAVYRGRVFLGGPDGTVVALDAKSGCTAWSAKAPAQIRTGILIAEVGGRALAFLGDSAGLIHAYNAETGEQIWQQRLDVHATTLATSTPVIQDGKLYVGASSYEESIAARPDYVCCSFRGSVSALDAATGAVAWKTWTIAETPKAQPNNSHGQKVVGPSGAGVWAAPTVDAAKGLVYVATGDNYSDPPTTTSDSVLALSLVDGKIVWTKQLTAGDAFNVACGAGANCPDSKGPDFDLATSPMLVALRNGKRALIVGQKSGQMHALDPDRQGQLLWTTRVGKGSALGGIQWGPATDGNLVFAAVSDVGFRRGANGRELDPSEGGGISGLRIDNGEIVWKTPHPGCDTKRPCSPAQSSAVTASAGFVLSGSLDGHLRGYSTATGKIIWDFDSVRDFATVNGVKGSGGSFDAGGAVVAGGMLFAASGYAQFGGIPGNVLLAFALER